MSDTDDPIEGFLQELRRKGKQPTTISEYATNLREYADHLAATPAFSPFTADQDFLLAYFATLRNKPHSHKTIWKKQHAVYALYEWLQSSSILLLNPCPRPIYKALPCLPRDIPDWSALQRVYERLRHSEKLCEQRDYVMIDLAYSCGLRRCELHGLDVEDICAEDGTIRVTGKRGKQRMVPLGANTLADLQRYIYNTRPKLLKSSDTDALFVSSYSGGKRMHLYSINASFCRLRKRHGFDRCLLPHNLRHAFATDLVRSGAPIADVSRMLGHEKLETTQIYTHLAATDLKAHHKKHHPRA